VRIPMAEDHPQSPINPYGESKLFVEKVLRWYESAYQLKWISLRYFDAASADPDGEIGENHHPEAHRVPLAVQAALGARAYVEIFGSDSDTPAGTAIRDCVHVTDLARTHVMALQYLLDGGSSLAVNLGSGVGSSVRVILATVEGVCGSAFEIRCSPRRAGDPQVLLADPSLVKQALGWTALLSNPDAIVNTAWQWLLSMRAQKATT
jgi:UDP-glucose 4-epimerase